MTCLLLRNTPDPDRLVALAARRCYSSRAAQDIEEHLSMEEIERLLAFLRQRNHLSPFEHADFTFSADGVSRALSHQLVRHRIASYSQESQRYVNYMKTDQLPYIVPPSIAKNSAAARIYAEAVDKTLLAYREMVNAGVAPEDARYVFPNAIETKLVFTLNARSLFNFFEQRCCVKAQWEIRHLALDMLNAVRKVAPLIFKSAGAPCQFDFSPYCRENDTQCPLYKSMIKRIHSNDPKQSERNENDS